VSHDPSVEVLVNDRADIAECPLWSVPEGALYWVDIRAHLVHRMHVGSGRRDTWNVGSDVGSIGLRKSGGLLVATRNGIEFLDTTTGKRSAGADPEPDAPANRLNDGKVDRRGRFWVGSTNDGLAPIGRLYRVTPDLQFAAFEDDIIMPNAIAWHPDNTRMYFADSWVGTIWVYDFDADSGTVRNRRAFTTLDEKLGKPDGATVDSEGYLWYARMHGWAIARHAPDGTLDRIIELPAQRVTSLGFGGDDLRTIYITTGTLRLEPHELAAQPLAGAILSVRVDVPGIAEPAFAG
jgi:L-arabinonolactonase